MFAFGQVRQQFPLIAADLSPGVRGDGLLGLDFFRGHVLHLDFVRGAADLDPRPRRWWRAWG